MQTSCSFFSMLQKDIMMIFKASICLLILATLFLHNTESMPSFQRRQVPNDGPSGVFAIPDEEQCVPFEHYYCTKFGYNTTTFPNIRDHETVEEAAAEFENFIPLLTANCSSKIGTLLCFVYFPYCDPETGFIIQPCEQTCIEAHTDECTAIVNQVGGWAGHLQCNLTVNEERVYKKETCANGTQPVWEAPCVGIECNNIEGGGISDGGNDGDISDGSDYGDDGDETESELDNNNHSSECTEDTHNCINTEACKDTLTGYECKCPDDQEGDGRADGTGCTDCSECKMRSKANANTFKNNCYTFATHVSLLSVSKCDDNYCAEFAVQQQFDLETRDTVSGTMTLAPNMTGHVNVTIFINDNCYLCQHLEINQQYLIGGVYKPERIASTSYTWEIPQRGLVSKWRDTYDQKLKNWINNTANTRATSDCTVTLS